MADSGTPPLLAVRELGVDFLLDAGRTTTAVDDVSFEVRSGQTLALVGESGSGKSVTALALLGLLPREARVRGSAMLGGVGTHPGTGEPPVQLIGARPATLRDVRGRRIGAVFQDPFSTFNPVQRIGRQIVEALGAHRQTRVDDPRARTLELLEQVGLDDPRRAYASYPHELSGGQLQRAMIAMAISDEPDLLIADEPTTALDVTVQAGVLALLHRLQAEMGMAILLITHDMGVVADLADDVVVLRQAHVVESGEAVQVFGSPRAEYTRELLSAVPRIDEAAPAAESIAAEHEAATGDGAAAQSAVALRDVIVTYGSGRGAFTAVRSASLTVPVGETVGLVGESGSGKTTIGKAIARLVPVSGGTIELAGHDVSALHGRSLREARGRIGFVFQNPGDSLNPRARVGDIVAEPLQIHTDLGRDERRARAAELLSRVDLPADAPGRYPHQLSGGQRQRVSIARALVLRPALLIADEPTSALDVAVQARILALIAELQRELDFGCLFISHDLAVVRQVSQQVVVMRAGEVVESGATDTVLSRPVDPYTRRLLDSIPVPDPTVQRARRAEPAAAGRS